MLSTPELWKDWHTCYLNESWDKNAVPNITLDLICINNFWFCQECRVLKSASLRGPGPQDKRFQIKLFTKPQMFSVLNSQCGQSRKIWICLLVKRLKWMFQCAFNSSNKWISTKSCGGLKPSLSLFKSGNCLV